MSATVAYPARLLRIMISESDRWEGRPLHEAIVEKCRANGIAGATVFRGLEGFGGNAEIHRPHLMRHDQPLVITIVDAPDALERLIADVEPMIDTGVMALSSVQVIRLQKQE
jgi:uncharacterized protein